MKELFSIIIPHHNAPSLLRRCLHSIPMRDDVQVIVVDDKSNEEHIPVLKGLESEFPSCEFLYLEKNYGAGHARNVGIDHARGRWLLFADSDDFYVEEFSMFLDSYQDAPEDIIYFRNRYVLSEDISKPAHRDNWINALFDKSFAENNDRIIRCNHCVPWGKMIRKSFVDSQHIRFDEVPYSNDVMFALLSGCSAQSIHIIDHPLYVLTERFGSLTSQFATKPGELETRAAVCFRAHKYIRGLGKEYYDCFKVMPMSEYMSRMFHQDKKLFNEYFPRLLELFPSYSAALKEVRIYENNRFKKIRLYVYSGLVYIQQNWFGATKHRGGV